MNIAIKYSELAVPWHREFVGAKVGKNFILISYRGLKPVSRIGSSNPGIEMPG